MHPYLPDTGSGRVRDHRCSDFPTGQEKSGCQGRLDVLHPGEAAVLTYAGCVRVHRNSVITLAAEFVENGDAEVPGVARGAHHGNTFLGEGPQRLREKRRERHSCSYLTSLPERVQC